MWTYEEALTVIRAYVDALGEGRWEVIEDATLDLPYGWVFFYQSRAYLETKDFSEALAGNAPLIFNRMTGEHRDTGTAYPIEHYLRQYEAEIPPALLEMQPLGRTRNQPI